MGHFPFIVMLFFSCSFMSHSLRPHEPQHARPPCPSPTPGVHPKSVMPSSHLILCRPLFFLPPIPPGIRVFSNELTLHMRWPKYWSFSFSISPSNEHPGLVFYRMDSLDLLAIQADDTTLMSESEEELKILLMKVKVESEKVGFKLNIQKTKSMASGAITSWQIDGERMETVSDFVF